MNREQVLIHAAPLLPYQFSVSHLSPHTKGEVGAWCNRMMGPRMVDHISGGDSELPCYHFNRQGKWLVVEDNIWLRNLTDYTYLKLTWGGNVR